MKDLVHISCPITTPLSDRGKLRGLFPNHTMWGVGTQYDHDFIKNADVVAFYSGSRSAFLYDRTLPPGCFKELITAHNLGKKILLVDQDFKVFNTAKEGEQNRWAKTGLEGALGRGITPIDASGISIIGDWRFSGNPVNALWVKSDSNLSTDRRVLLL